MPTAYQATFAGGELTPALHYRSDLAKWRTGAALMRNFISLIQGGASTRPGTQYIGAAKVTGAGPPRLIPFIFDADQSYVVEAGHLYMRFISDGSYLAVGGVPVEIATPYNAPELGDLKWAQSADVLTITHPAHPVMELRRLGLTSWQLATVTFAAVIPAPASVTVTADRGEGDTINSSPHPAILPYSYAMTATSIATADTSNLSTVVDTTNYELGYWDQYGVNNVIQGNPVTGADFYSFYRDYRGVFGFIGSSVAPRLQDTNFLPDTAQTPPDHRDPFSVSGNPSCVGFHQQRRWFGASLLNPQTLWATRTGNYSNMDTSQPTRDDDAITLTLAAQQLNLIRHLVAVQDLLVFTTGGVWKLYAGANQDAITPSALVAVRQVSTGASQVHPVQIVNEVLYVDLHGLPRALQYNFYVAIYTPVDLSVMAAHLFAARHVVEWAWAEAPFKVMWCVCDDGTFLGMTYLKEQEIVSWHRHDTQGFVKSVAVVPENLGYGLEDAVYLVVDRVVGGQTVSMVERMHTRRLGTANNDVKEAWFVDAGLQYRGAPAKTISGLDHLDGLTVSILADGNVVPSQVVVSGAITLQHAASIVTVGLPFQAQLQTLPLDPGQPSVLGARRRISQVRLMLENSRGLKAGTRADLLTEFKERKGEAMGQPTALVTGTEQVLTLAGWDYEQRVMVQQDYPLPATVLGAFYEWDTET